MRTTDFFPASGWYMIIIVAAAIIIFVPFIAICPGITIYKWTDKNGVVNFTRTRKSSS